MEFEAVGLRVVAVADLFVDSGPTFLIISGYLY